MQAVCIDKIAAPDKITEIDFLVRVMNYMWVGTNRLGLEPVFMFTWPLEIFGINVISPMDTAPNVTANADDTKTASIFFP